MPVINLYAKFIEYHKFDTETQVFDRTHFTGPDLWGNGGGGVTPYQTTSISVGNFKLLDLSRQFGKKLMSFFSFSSFLVRQF